jgi:predicted alpha/beta hydrolase family esterase
MVESSRRCRVLLVPGVGDSGPEHWQTLWEARQAHQRVRQRDWDHPVCSEWMESLDRAARHLAPDLLIAAHSLGTLLATHWLVKTGIRIRGALLVAPPDPQGQRFPLSARGFAPVAAARLPCPSIVVASGDDPYAAIAFARQCADCWGSRFVDIGNAGHINAASGLGEWDQGYRLLQTLDPGIE